MVPCSAAGRAGAAGCAAGAWANPAPVPSSPGRARGSSVELRGPRLPADHGLALADQRTHALGQIEVGAAAEADDTEARAGVHGVALAHMAQDAPRDQPGD